MKYEPKKRVESIYKKRPQIIDNREERAEKLKKHLAEKTVISRTEYSRLCSLSRITAIRDLNTFLEEGWLRKYGTARTVVYMLK